MIVTMTFNLPADEDELTLARSGKDFWLVLWSLDQHLRGKIKYDPGAPEGSDAVATAKHDARIDALQECRDKLHELLQEYNVSLDCVS
jgi:hypothetical protein